MNTITLANADIMEEGGVALMDRSQNFAREVPLNKNCAENLFVNGKNTLRNTFPVVIENTLSRNHDVNSDRKTDNTIESFNEMTGYFSDYGNLTIFLDNSLINNEIPCQRKITPMRTGDCYVVSDDSPPRTDIKQDKSSALPKTKPKVAPIPKLRPINNAIEFVNLPSIDTDIPEYIDIHALALTSSFQKKLQLKNINNQQKISKPVPQLIPSVTFAKIPNIIKQEVKEQQSDFIQCSSSDEEVVFVKEFRPDECTAPSVLIPEKPRSIVLKMPAIAKRKSAFVPRRNPKRQAQIQKTYDDDYEFDFSADNGDSDEKLGSYADYKLACRRSQRTFTERTTSSTSTGSSSDYGSSIPNEYMREWPVDGMHERPHYNPVTQKLEKYDHVPKPKLKSKVKPAKLKPRVGNKSTTVAAKRKKKPATKVVQMERINKEFAQLTHETFVEMMDYVNQVRRSHEIFDKHRENQGEDGVPVDSKESIQKVKDILLDSSILYCLANNLSQQDLAKYFIAETKKTVSVQVDSTQII